MNIIIVGCGKVGYTLVEQLGLRRILVWCRNFIR